LFAYDYKFLLPFFMFMKHIYLWSLVLFGFAIFNTSSYVNAAYVDWDCQSRDALTQMKVFMDEKTVSLNEVKLARLSYKQSEIDPLILELGKLLNPYVDFSVNASGDNANEIMLYVSRTPTATLSGSNLEKANQLISEITTKVANQPKWNFDMLSYNNRTTIQNACIKKFADIDKQKSIELEVQQKSEESNRLQEAERAKINAASQKEQEEAAIRALTKKKLELELEVLVKQKLEQTSWTWTIQWSPILTSPSSSSWAVKNIDDKMSEFQLLKTAREKNAFIGKKTVALKRELRSANKARVKEIINEMRELKKIQSSN